jgi:cysteinyl-tRNA synthetase
MGLTLYNDLTRKKEPFIPVTPGKVSFYSCGPTVYDYFHIGNSRPFIVFDVLRRFLESKGLEVTFVQNFTDIDDKMINRAKELGISVKELADKTIADYFEDADALGVKRATHYPKATEHIDEIISLVQELISKGHAYEVEGDVYFEVSTFPEYGKLSKQTIDELQSGARINVDERKKHPLDFALWKAQKPGEPAWESPWGLGRPGWHIECSAMSMKYLGETLDIHSGGCDLTFPHHENEIAQAEAATGKPFVKYWIHNGYLLIDKEKMSKSLGNFLTARAARKKFSPLTIRLFMLSAHYRSPINFSEETLEQSKGAVERLLNCWSDLQHARQNRDLSAPSNEELLGRIETLYEKFTAEMDDDFNTAGALGYVFEAVRFTNSYLKDNQTLSLDVIEQIEDFFHKIDNIMGIMGLEKLEDAEGAEDIEALISERQQARKNRDFKRADEIRDMLGEKGIILEDTPEGTKWKKEL